jgi:hypothetical protein
MNSLSVPALNRKRIGAPPCIAMKRDYFPIMSSYWFAGMALQEQLCLPHNPVNSLMIYPLFVLLLELKI